MSRSPGDRPTSASRSIDRLLRVARRNELRKALRGEWGDRWRYCWQRQMAVIETDLRLYGEVRHGYVVGAGRILHNYHRLTRLAARWAKQRSDL